MWFTQSAFLEENNNSTKDLNLHSYTNLYISSQAQIPIQREENKSVNCESNHLKMLGFCQSIQFCGEKEPLNSSQWTDY